MMPSPNTPPLLSVRHLATGYGKKQVLFDVNLDVMPGEVVLITGGNGSGKSTLLKAIYGLLPSWNANTEIHFRPDQDRPVVSTRNPVHNLANGLAYLPQKKGVFEDLTVEDNLRLAAYTLPNRDTYATRRDEVLDSLPDLAQLLNRKPETMSGGERQIVSLAMLLLHKPTLLLLDEPTAGLDSRNADLVLTVLRTAQAKNRLGLIVVEHRKNECSALGGRVCYMRLGILEQDMIECETVQ